MHTVLQSSKLKVHIQKPFVHGNYLNLSPKAVTTPLQSGPQTCLTDYFNKTVSIDLSLFLHKSILTESVMIMIIII